MISRTTDVFAVSKRNLGSLIPFLSFMPFFSFYMITLVQLVVLGLEAWASRLLALTICTGTSTGDCMVILASQKYFCGMNPLDCKTVGFFLKISKEVGKAWRKSLACAKRASLTRPTGVSPQSRSLFSASFKNFCSTMDNRKTG